MYTPRFARLLLVSLMTLLVITPAHAAQPVVQTILVNTTFVNKVLSAACGFQITHRLEGTIRVTHRFDAAGNLAVEVDQFHLHGSFSAHGKTVEFVVAERDNVSINRDGSATVYITGLTGRLTVPGQGLVTADVGRLVLFFDSPTDENPDVLFEAGQHDNGPAPELCTILSP
jgi:hypothetical protein